MFPSSFQEVSWVKLCICATFNSSVIIGSSSFGAHQLEHPHWWVEGDPMIHAVSGKPGNVSILGVGF